MLSGIGKEINMDYQKLLDKFNKENGTSFWTNVRDNERNIYLLVQNENDKLDTHVVTIELSDKTLSSKKLIRSNLLRLLSNLKGEGYIPASVDLSTPEGCGTIKFGKRDIKSINQYRTKHGKEKL